MSIEDKIKQIQALSEVGIHYAHNDFDLERYREISTACFSLLSEISGIPEEQIRIQMLESNGYKTPKVDIRAVVFNEKDEVLMVREKIDNCWSLPGGWADIGFTPSEVAIKETREEAGADVTPQRILAILDKRCHHHPPDMFYIYKVFIECRFNGWVEKDDKETTDAGFFPFDALPPLSPPRNTPEQMKMLLDFRTGRLSQPVFD